VRQAGTVSMAAVDERRALLLHLLRSPGEAVFEWRRRRAPDGRAGRVLFLAARGHGKGRLLMFR